MFKKANNTVVHVCCLLLLSGVLAQAAPVLFSASGTEPVSIETSDNGFRAAPTANNRFSFLDVKFNAGERQVNTGRNATPVIGDFTFAEPVNIPEPSTWVLFWSGAAALLLASRPLFKQ